MNSFSAEDRFRSARERCSLVFFLFIFWFSSSPAWAHEKWYYSGTYPSPTAADLAEPLTLTLIGAIAAITLLGGWVYRRRGSKDLIPGPTALGATQESLAHFYALVPAILGFHIAVPLLVNGVNGNLFSPNNHLQALYLLGVIETGIAIAIFYGAFTRIAAQNQSQRYGSAPCARTSIPFREEPDETNSAPAKHVNRALDISWLLRQDNRAAILILKIPWIARVR